jgi:PadR family transcriptional regulator PadR
LGLSDGTTGLSVRNRTLFDRSTRKIVAFISTIEMKHQQSSKGGALVQGTLDMLVLRVLALEPMHGFGVTRRIEQVSQDTFEVQPGSLFPAFRRLEREGLVTSEWRATEHNRRAKYYQITQSGRRRLKTETHDWRRQTLAIERILGGT